jgi:hypothetical protein
LQSILLLAVLIAVLAFFSWYKRAPKAQQKKVAGRILIFGGIGVLLLLVLTGRLNPLFALAAAAVPIVQRAFTLFQLFQGAKGASNAFKASRGPSPGQTSEVETRFLHMTLNHDSGDMDGTVLEGPQRGKRLSELTLPELQNMLQEYRRNDAQSAAVLEAFLDRYFADQWRAGESADEQGRAAAGGDGKMSAEEAREILGVGADATREQIIEAHRHLMQKFHPDRGGSTYLAAKINEAKRVLLTT